MTYVPPDKPHWRERDGPSRVPASVARQFVPLHKGHWREREFVLPHEQPWRERDGPSLEPALVPRRSVPPHEQYWRKKEFIPHEQHWREREREFVPPHEQRWRERDGLSHESASVLRQFLPQHEQHRREREREFVPPHEQRWRERDGPWRFVPPHEQHWRERDGPSREPASVPRRFIPPHEQHWREKDGPSPVPASVLRQFKKGLNLRSPKTFAHQSGLIEYGKSAMSKWLAVGSDDDRDHLPSSASLKLISVEAIDRQSGEKLLALAKSCTVNEDDATGREHGKKPWVHIAETVIQDLVCSFEALRSEIKDQSMNEIKPTLVARFGKIHFHRSPSFPVETSGHMVTKASLKRLKRSFYTNLPSFYMENVTHKVIPEIGLSFKDKKDIYLVKFCDKSRPGATICCKCRVVKEEQRLEIYKVELGQRRQMVVDVSCLNKDLDMRLMSRAKRLFSGISEEEKNSIRDMISSAILDSSVTGGLRFPLRKAFSGDRYRVVGAWHTISTNYNNSSMRLKVKHADRFDFRYSQGEVTEEITLKLTGITSELHGQRLGTDSICDMLKDAVKMMWEHFLSCGNTVI